jgi:hypothetical protein
VYEQPLGLTLPSALAGFASILGMPKTKKAVLVEETSSGHKVIAAMDLTGLGLENLIP